MNALFAHRSAVRLRAIVLLAIALGLGALSAGQPDPPAAAAKTQLLRGKVIGVHDGDTLTLLDADQAQHKVRLLGIDAPELKQPWGTQARQALAERVFGEEVQIKWSVHDRYGRILGRIERGGRWINRDLVAAGMAWHYIRYDQSAELAEAQQRAREKRYGLWADADPVPPWDWRRKEKARAKVRP